MVAADVLVEMRCAGCVVVGVVAVSCWMGSDYDVVVF